MSRKPIRTVKVHDAKIVSTYWIGIRQVVIKKDDEEIQLRLDGRRREDWEVKIDELRAEDAVVCVEYRRYLWEIGGKWGVVNYLVRIEREQP